MTTPSIPPTDESARTGPLTSSLAARVERLPVATRIHRRWAYLLAFFLFFDFFDVATFGSTAPALKAEWNLSIGQVGLGASAAFLGMFLGAIVGGRLSDRFGRRPVLLAAAVTFSLASLLTAVATNFETLVLLRLATGFGLQAMTGVVLVYVSEMFPRQLRGRYLSILLAVATCAMPVTAGIARLVVPVGPGGWRWVFVIGGLGIVGVLFAAKFLPETVRWQATHARGDRAVALVERLEAEARKATGRELPEVVQDAPVPAGKLRDLVRSRYLKRTVVASLAMIMLLQATFGFQSWVATLLVQRGYSQAAALTIVFIMLIATVVGMLVPYPFVDRIERKTSVFILALVAAVAVLCFAFVRLEAVMVAGGFVFMMALSGIVAVMNTYLPEIYPTPLRGLGSGLCNGLGRLAAIGGSFIVAGIFTGFGFGAVFVYIAALMVLLGLIMVIGAARTTNRSLDQI